MDAENVMIEQITASSLITLLSRIQLYSASGHLICTNNRESCFPVYFVPSAALLLFGLKGVEGLVRVATLCTA